MSTPARRAFLALVDEILAGRASREDVISELRRRTYPPELGWMPANDDEIEAVLGTDAQVRAAAAPATELGALALWRKELRAKRRTVETNDSLARAAWLERASRELRASGQGAAETACVRLARCILDQAVTNGGDRGHAA